MLSVIVGDCESERSDTHTHIVGVLCGSVARAVMEEPDIGFDNNASGSSPLSRTPYLAPHQPPTQIYNSPATVVLFRAWNKSCAELCVPKEVEIRL